MDEDIAAWVLEFLLHKQIDQKLINGVLLSLPFSDNNLRLKKMILLRRIESEISNGSISETLLDLIEIIEQLELTEGKTASKSMKRAYCRVAADCTVRFLDEDLEKKNKYFDAVQRIWRERILRVESLISEESKRRFGEIEVAMMDCEIRGEILTRNTRNDGLKAVRVYLREAWESLGSTYLELVADKLGNNVERLCVPVEENETDKARFRQTHVETKSKRCMGAKNSDVDEGDEDESRNENSCTLIPGVNTVQTELSMDKNAAAGNNLPKILQTAHILSYVAEPDHCNSEIIVENQTGPRLKATPEVERLRETLKSSSTALRAAVRDPLPDALETATILLRMETNKANRETVVVDQTRAESDALREAKMKDKSQDAQGNVSQYRSKFCDLPRHNLMEASDTAHTFQSDDSIDNFSGGSPTRPRLPLQTKSYPLNKSDNVAKPYGKRKFWTPEEEAALRAGVHKFGVGKWKLILHCFREVLRDRTNENLKDKWRLMTKWRSS